jgi:hypothetical protein
MPENDLRVILPANVRPGDIIKIRYHLEPGEQDNWQSIKDNITRQCVKAGLVVHLVQPVMAARQQSVAVRKVTTKSDEKIVRDFGQQLGVSKETLAAGVGFLREA